jgi:GT2 family glycosyltransferase
MPMELMGLSVIIPTLNEASNIVNTIGTLQRYGGSHVLEILVVDGGSTDNTVQLNMGAEHSQGEILYFVHADTIAPQTFADEISSAMTRGVEMGCFRYKFDSPSWLLRINAYFTRFHFLFCQGGDKTFFIRRKLFFELGQYDIRYVIMEEYDFLRRAQKRGHHLAVLPCECLVSARKYTHNSWLRVQIANAVVFNLWAWGGARPETLRAVYRRILRG